MARVPSGYTRAGFGDDSIVYRKTPSRYIKRVFVNDDGNFDTEYYASHLQLDTEPDFPLYYDRTITQQAFSKAKMNGATWKVVVTIESGQVPIEVLALDGAVPDADGSVTYTEVYAQGDACLKDETVTE